MKKILALIALILFVPAIALAANVPWNRAGGYLYHLYPTDILRIDGNGEGRTELYDGANDTYHLFARTGDFEIQLFNGAWANRLQFATLYGELNFSGITSETSGIPGTGLSATTGGGISQTSAVNVTPSSSGSMSWAIGPAGDAYIPPSAFNMDGGQAGDFSWLGVDGGDGQGDGGIGGDGTSFTFTIGGPGTGGASAGDYGSFTVNRDTLPGFGMNVLGNFDIGTTSDTSGVLGTAGKLNVKADTSGPTGKGFVLTDSLNREIITTRNDGKIGIGSTTPIAYLGMTVNAAATPGIAVRGASGQTADLHQWYNSSGALIGKITAAGQLGAGLYNSGVNGIFTGFSSGPFIQALAPSNQPATVNLTSGSITSSLSLTSSSGQLNLNTGGAGIPLVMQINSVEGARLHTNNNFGIGTATPQSNLQVNGSIAATSTVVTATYTVKATDYLILCNAAAGGFTITLPTALTATSRIYKFVKIDSTGNVCTIDGNASDTINFALTQTLDAAFEKFEIQQATSTSWIITSD